VQDELFHIELPTRPEAAGPARKKWGGRASINARKICRAMLPAGCWRCGRMITPDMPDSAWHAGHLEDRGQGGSDSSSNYAPECSGCNTSAGGKLGAAITNGTKVSVAYTKEVLKKWW